ncbi:hypothetical protein ABK040_016530 [Willaertia magna]
MSTSPTITTTTTTRRVERIERIERRRERIIHLFRKLEGEYIGHYQAHGFEIICVKFNEEKEQLEGLKLIGDPYVCSGQLTFKFILNEQQQQQNLFDINHHSHNHNHNHNANTLNEEQEIEEDNEAHQNEEQDNEEEEDNEDLYKSLRGWGQIANYGFMSSRFIPGKFIYINEIDYRSFVFSFTGYSTVSFFKRDLPNLNSLLLQQRLSFLRQQDLNDNCNNNELITMNTSMITSTNNNNNNQLEENSNNSNNTMDQQQASRDDNNLNRLRAHTISSQLTIHNVIPLNGEEELDISMRIRDLIQTISLNHIFNYNFITTNKGLNKEQIENNTENVIYKNNLKLPFNQLDCVICLSCFEQDDKLRKLKNCQHLFHKDCIDRWLVREKYCPSCKQSIL